MKLRNGTFLAALAASLTIHLLAIPISVRVYFAKPDDESTGIGSADRFEEMVVRIEDPHDSPETPADNVDAKVPEQVEPEKDASAAVKPPAEVIEPLEIKPEPPKPKPEPEKSKPEMEEFPIGDTEGTGFASHDVAADQEAKAKQANEDQAFLSRDPVGNGRVGNEPSQNTAQGKNGQGGTPGEAVVDAVPRPAQTPPGEKGTLGGLVKMPSPEQISSRVTQWIAKLRTENAGTAAAQSPVKSTSTSLAAPKPAPPVSAKAAGAKEVSPRIDDNGPIAVVGASVATRRIPKIAPAPTVDSKSLPAQADVKVGPDLVIGEKDAPTVNVAKNVIPPIGVERVGQDPKPQAVEQQAVVAAKVGTGDGRPPGSDAPAADPAPMSENESDAFSKLGSTIIRNGKLEIKAGRKVRSVRPRFTLAGQIDLMSMDDPKIVLNITTDATGRVSGVEIAKSSGSNEVDQPVRRTMYEWWFEPDKDKKGNSIPGRFQWTINWIK